MNKMSKEERYEYIWLASKMGKKTDEIAVELECSPSTVNRVKKVVTAFNNDDFEAVVMVGRATGINRLVAWCEERFNKKLPDNIREEYQQVANAKNEHSVFSTSTEREAVIDVVEVTRCKDCKAAKHPDNSLQWGKVIICGLYASRPIMRADDYCSYGERKAGNR